MNFRKIFFVLSALVFLLACTLFSSAPSADTAETSEAGNDAVISTPDVLATMVAATVEGALAADVTPEPLLDLHVVYVKDGEAYLWTAESGSRRVTDVGGVVQVAISDDASHIAFLRLDAENPSAVGLWVMNSNDLLSTRALVSHAELETLKAGSPFSDAAGLGIASMTWRPGTYEIAYETMPLFEGPGYFPSEDLRVINADTFEQRTIFEFGEGGAFVFSPDGSQIAVAGPDRIRLINADGSRLRSDVLSYPPVMTYSEYQFHPNPIWSADSNSLRVFIPPQDPLADSLAESNLWHIPADASAASLLGSVTAVPFEWTVQGFSPNLRYYAYVMPVGDGSFGELHIFQTDDAGDFSVASGEGIRFEGWTPNSERFVYSLRGDDDKGVYLGNLAGERVLIASDWRTMNLMRWVDASRFLYLAKGSEDGWELRISDMDGSAHAFLDRVEDSYISFDFAPAP